MAVVERCTPTESVAQPLLAVHGYSIQNKVQARVGMPVLAKMTYYERNLPHWHPAGRIIFLTWRLYGSLPASFLRSLGEDKAQPAGKFFRVVDCQLDQARTGPLWLKDPRIAGYVVRALQRGEVELEQYALLSFVVMANHVHVLLEPKIDVARITKGIKGVTAKEANQILGRTGKTILAG